MKLAAVVLVLTVAGGCSKSPTAPAPLLPPAAVDLTGTVWTGHFRISSCSSPNGCPNFVGVLYPFTLTISSGSRVEAKLESSTPDTYVAVLPGVIQPDGTHVFSGTSSNGSVEIRELRISKDRVANITGAISYTSNVTSRDPRTLTGVIPSATLQRDLRTPGAAGSTSLVGSWFGTGRTDTCQGFSCGSVGSPGDFTITIRESGSRITALLDSDIWARKVVELEGIRQPDNAVRFTGSWTGETPGRSGEFRHFTVRTDPALGLVGTFEWFETAQTGAVTRLGTIVSASRYVVLRSPGVFQGSWRGGYVARTCSGDCNQVSFSNVQSFNITLQQVGLSVSGRAFVPLDGSISADGATLSGENIVEPCPWDYEGNICTQRIRNLSVTVDDFGRMSGTFEYFKEGWSGSLHYRYTITAELRDVIRRLQ